MSSLAASPQMSLPSLRCVKSLEVRDFLTSVPRRWSCIHTTIYFYNHNMLYMIAVPPVFLSGRSYCVRTQRMLNQCLESLVQKVQSGVVINFEKTGPDPPLIGEGEFLDDTHWMDTRQQLNLCANPVFKIVMDKFTNMYKYQHISYYKSEQRYCGQ